MANMKWSQHKTSHQSLETKSKNENYRKLVAQLFFENYISIYKLSNHWMTECIAGGLTHRLSDCMTK